MSKSLNRTQIEALIPHRAPILLLDEVTNWEAGTFLEATRYFPENDPLFVGHFPGNPLLPGVLTTETIAQAGALHTSLTEGLNAETGLYLFMGIDKARFKAPILPGHTVHIRVEKLRDKLDIYEFKGTAHVDGKLAATTSFTAKLIRK
jgi:3-hydroxyacyl-[acyl-carrier-protein] dehydratase